MEEDDLQINYVGATFIAVTLLFRLISVLTLIDVVNIEWMEHQNSNTFICISVLLIWQVFPISDFELLWGPYIVWVSAFNKQFPHSYTNHRSQTV